MQGMDAIGEFSPRNRLAPSAFLVVQADAHFSCLSRDMKMRCLDKRACARTRQTYKGARMSRHRNKEIQAALEYAASNGWQVIQGGSHAWGKILCPHAARDGCRMWVYSTPKNPYAHAQDIRRRVDRCPH